MNIVQASSESQRATLGGFLRWTAVSVFCGAVLLGTARRAAALTVTNTNDSGPGSLRAAIASAASPDTIDFAPGLTGTITLTSGTLTTNKTLTITGPGATALAISGNNTTKVFHLYSTVSISGLTITQGYGSPCGGIHSGSPLTLSGCAITQCSGANTGGIYCGALTMQNCTISGNTGGVGGVNVAGYASITNCTFVGNYSGGAALAIFYPGANVKNCTISGNNGQGAYARPTGTTCTFDSCTFSGNTSNGLSSRPRFGGTVVLQNSTVYGNQNTGVLAKAGGYATTNILSSTISGNSGGVFNADVGNAYVYLSNSIVAQNTSFDVFGISAGYYNLIGGNPMLGPLANNGGPTQTMALLPGSPAIDAGSSGLTVDQRGFPRPIGAGVDIGAYERDTVSPTAALGSAPNVNNASNPTLYTFTVIFSDNIAVNESTIGNANILVTGPNGFSQLAKLQSVSPAANGTPLTATYTIVPPSGAWTTPANGTYTISMLANQVTDTTGNPVAPGTLGTFSVAILSFTAAPTASPNPQLIGQPIQFNAAAAGVGPLSFAWNFGDGTSGTGTSPTHIYPIVGTYSVTVTVTDGNGQTITATISVNAVPLTFISGPTAAPNPAVPNQAVQFSAVANGGQPITYAWSFGDGASDTGTNVSHIFTAPGVYTVTVTATDVNGLKVTTTLTVFVLDPNTDFDGDGFTNDVELALGTDPLNPASTPFGLPKPTSNAAVSVKKLKIQLRYGIPNSDSMSLTGSLPIPSKLLGQYIIFNIGHVIKAFQLDAKGNGANSTGKTGLLNDSFKMRRGNFTLKLNRGAFQAALNSDPDPSRQLNSTQGSSPTRTVKVTIYFNNSVLSGDIVGKFKAQKGQFSK